jgi:hypothetical protein
VRHPGRLSGSVAWPAVADASVIDVWPPPGFLSQGPARCRPKDAAQRI